MIKTINNIINGWKNYYQGSDPVTLELAKERAKICVECPKIKYGKHAAILPDVQIGEIKGHYCGLCKCPISTAVRSKDYKCPENKW